MQPLFYSQASAFKTILDSDKSGDQTLFSRQLILLAAINEQFLLTQHLIQNQFKLQEELKKEKQSSDSGQSSLPNNQKFNHRQSAQEEEDFKFASDKLDNDDSSNSTPKQQSPLTRLRIKKVFKYDFDSDSENQVKEVRKCETKNIIKNFMKSIFSFIRKHKSYVYKVLNKLEINEDQFMEALIPLQGKINTIFQLRSLWTEGPYCQVFRILSSYFLRKYSPKHIFHSRISNHQVHLKYRQKLLESVINPNLFTSLKDF